MPPLSLMVNRVRIHPVFSVSTRAIVLPEEEPVTKPAIDIRAQSNGHQRPRWDHQKDYTDLEMLAQEVENLSKQVVRILRALNQTKAELADQKKKAEKYDEMVVTLSRSETEKVQALKRAKDSDAVADLVREALKDYLNDKTPGTATLNNLAKAMDLLT
jgi:hypothetical protein